MSHALLFTLIPVAAALAAGLFAVALHPGAKVTGGFQHFAAGVVFAAAAIELLPTVLKKSPGVAIGGFAAGIAVMFAMRTLTGRLESRRTAATARTGLPLGFNRRAHRRNWFCVMFQRPHVSPVFGLIVSRPCRQPAHTWGRQSPTLVARPRSISLISSLLRGSL